MEEEKIGTQPQKTTDPKIYFANYSQILPKEILSFLKISEPPANIILQDHTLHFKENLNSSEILLSIDPKEKSQEILCKAYPIDLTSFEKFVAANSELLLEKALQEDKTLKGFNLRFFCQEFSSKVKLIYVGDYQGSPLLSLSFQDFSLISDALDEKYQAKTEKFLIELWGYFKDVLDENALKYYLKKIMTQSQDTKKSSQFIEKIYKKHEPVVLIDENKEKEKNLLFGLKTKDFYGGKILELPKFNSEKGVFEPDEKIKLNL